MTRPMLLVAIALVAGGVGCRQSAASAPRLASGYVDATDIRLSAKVPGRIVSVAVTEGMRVKAGDPIATVSPEDLDLALQRARAERAQADAQLRLLRAGSRPEDIQQAQAQVAAATADRQAADADLTAARSDDARFTQLLDRRAGTTKQRDDAVARREAAEARVKAAADRLKAATAGLARLQAGARPEEIDGARAHVSAADAQIAALEHDRDETNVRAPSSGIVTARLVEPGELVAVGTPLAVIVDLDRAWVNAYVEAPIVPTLRLDETVTVVTDAGQRMTGAVAFISPTAEFTPRNVQTAAERAKLVYRVKVSVDNRDGVLKPGMPVEVDLGDGH